MGLVAHSLKAMGSSGEVEQAWLQCWQVLHLAPSIWKLARSQNLCQTLLDRSRCYVYVVAGTLEALEAKATNNACNHVYKYSQEKFRKHSLDFAIYYLALWACRTCNASSYACLLQAWSASSVGQITWRHPAILNKDGGSVYNWNNI